MAKTIMTIAIDPDLAELVRLKFRGRISNIIEEFLRDFSGIEEVNNNKSQEELRKDYAVATEELTRARLKAKEMQMLLKKKQQEWENEQKNTFQV